MNYIIYIIFLILFLFPQKQDTTYYNKQKRPSSYGINLFIKNNYDNLIAEYEYRIDSIYDVYIYVENLDENNTSDDLGQFYLPDEIILTNKEKYIEYEFKNLSKFRQKITPYNERTVKGVLFHELTHVYFNQTLKRLNIEGIQTSREYDVLHLFPNASLRFGAEFIEEGVCEYVVYYLNEATPIKDIVIPENIEELIDPDNKPNNMYQYSVYVLKDFLDKHGIKRGIEILLTNKPPTYEEILNPQLFFKRLTYDTRN